MDNSNVKIVKLEPMRVASVYAFGTSPEEEAWKKLETWAKLAGIWDNRAEHPIFGFSNPCTPNANAKYGYELWIKVDDTLEPSEQVRIEEYFGGTYAVVRCDTHGNPGKEIPQTWQALGGWMRETNTRFGSHQELEGFVTDGDDPNQLVLDLYMPIIEAQG